jgi:hypothetical protein
MCEKPTLEVLTRGREDDEEDYLGRAASGLARLLDKVVLLQPSDCSELTSLLQCLLSDVP